MIETREDYNRIINKLREIVQSWSKSNVYLVGGCVRDELLGLLPKDIDLVIDYSEGSTKFIDFIKDKFSDICSGFTIYPKYGTSKFTLSYDTDKNIDIECVIPRTEKYEGTTRKPSSVEFGSILEDAMRRDFCCNALYMNVLNSEVIDPTGNGLEDLKNKILRTPLDPIQTFEDDPLRMLRAIRFSCAKGFTIDPEVYSKIKPYSGYYTLSKERIQDEMNKIILSPKPIDGIKMLQDRGLLEFIIPEFSQMWGMDQKSKYHSLNFTDHTFKVLEGIMYYTGPNELELRWSALLHDIGKKAARKENLDGTCSYYRHDLFGASIAESILMRLKYSNDFIDIVKKLILNHMCIKSLYNYKTQEYTGSPHTTRRVSRNLGNLLVLEMKLIDSDNNAHAPEYCMPGQVKSFWEHYNNDVLLFKLNENIKQHNHSISGKDIMETFGLESGKLVGDIKKLFESWLLKDPELSKSDLIKKYKNLTDGIEMWITCDIKSDINGSINYLVSYNEPSIEEYLVNYPVSSTVCRYTEWKEDIVLKKGEKIKVKASNYPLLHIALQEQHKSEIIISEVGKKISEFNLLSGFSEINLNYDCQGDLVANIKWVDGRISSIM